MLFYICMIMPVFSLVSAADDAKESLQNRLHAAPFNLYAITAGDSKGVHREGKKWNQQKFSDLINEIPLLLRKELINSVDADGTTMLYRAMRAFNYEAMKMLLDAGADPNVVSTPRQITALYVAALSPHQKYAKLLLAYGADPDTADIDQHAPFTTLFVMNEAASHTLTTFCTQFLRTGVPYIGHPSMQDILIAQLLKEKKAYTMFSDQIVEKIEARQRWLNIKLCLHFYRGPFFKSPSELQCLLDAGADARQICRGLLPLAQCGKQAVIYLNILKEAGVVIEDEFRTYFDR